MTVEAIVTWTYRPIVVLLALGALRPAAPLAAQQSLSSVPTEELYSHARQRATSVSDDCGKGNRSHYLEAMTYLFAYYQVASRDGSLQGAPDFDRNLKQKYSTVLRTVRKCLDLVRNASAAMRDDGTGPKFEPPPPVYRVDLPDPPPPGAGVVATDAQGRTIPQLLAEITRVEQQRDALAAELASLRNRQPTPPPPPPPPPPLANLNGEYRIRVMASGLFWHEDGNGDRKLSTRWQPNDDFTRFILEAQADGSYRIRVKASGRYLHAPGHEDWIVSTLAQVDDDFTRFLIVPEPDGTTFRLRQKATGRFLGVRPDGLLTNNPQADDNFMRFRLIR
jgi:hypothetical protein